MCQAVHEKEKAGDKNEKGEKVLLISRSYLFENTGTVLAARLISFWDSSAVMGL